LNNDVIWHYMRRYRNFEKRQAFREAVAVANTHNPVLAVGSSAETDWEEINKMRLISARRNRKLFGVFAISLLVCAAACCLTLAANAQTNSTAAKIEVKLSEYKIDMPDEFGNLAWPISAVCFGPPCGTLMVKVFGSAGA
jgi:hypothetical protein